MALRSILAYLVLSLLLPVVSAGIWRQLTYNLFGSLSAAKARYLQTVSGFANEEFCYPALEGADENKDKLVDAEEYVTFVQLFDTSGLFDDISEFRDLPFALRVNFNFLRRVCPDDITSTNCPDEDDSAISVSGAYEDDEPTANETVYLFEVCRRTGDTINRLIASEPPSVAPTDDPSEEPSPAPTTLEPSVSPSVSPTETPSESPSIAPVTPEPSDVPITPEPSEAPATLAPTVTPTTAAPVTLAPSEAPTTAEPSVAPVPTEAPEPVIEVVPVNYQIAVRPGGTREIYIPQLIDALDSLAPEVLSTVTRRALREGRRLQTVNFPTTIDTIEVVDCPEIIPETDTCEDVTGTVSLIFQPEDEDNAESIAADFSTALEDSIEAGDLNAVLNLLSPGGDVYIIDSTVEDIVDPGDGEGRGISGGGIGGIVVGSVVVLALVAFAASRRKPEDKDDPNELQPAPQPDEVKRDLAINEEFDPELAAVIGKAAPDYGQNKDAMMDNDEAVAAMSDAASSAGDSGWSSSAGVSSLNTGSQDDLSLNVSRLASAADATGAATAVETPGAETTTAPGPAPQTPAITRADLDSAIEAGDWAAVGATAALLAVNYETESNSSQSNKDYSGVQSTSGSFDSSIDAARAAELDNLVESGDWEGVVLAAAKFEAAESRTDSGSGSDSRSNASRSNAAADDHSRDSTPSKNQKLQEYRAEVEELVRRVVPEEIENVDEMMLQFRGREDELIETLRTMEERAVAQKARQGAQKQAKVEAKRKTAEERAADASALLAAIPGPGSPEVTPAASAKSLGTGQVTETQPSVTNLGGGTLDGTAKSRSLGTGSMVEPKKARLSKEGGKSKREQRQSALEKAIEAGDWEAVGEAATMLSEGSVASSVETDEINRLADGISSQGSVGSRGNLSAKAEELEELIERGDWAGVVNAAGKTSKEQPTKEEEEEARRQRRLKHRKEEEEALAQAEIWEAIAEQTKQEAGGQSSDQAASAAADWAIGRSLQALVQAEQGDTLTKEEDSSKAVETDDEEEV